METIFRLFKLGINLDYQDQYAQVGYNNLSNSIEKEAGTLAMYVNHVENDPSQQVVVEVYRDEEAYQEHVASDHFKAFANLASQALTSRQVITLRVRKLLEKEESLRSLSGNDYCVKLAQVRVKEGQEEAFAKSVLPEMEAAMATEEGVLIMLAGQDAENPQDWYFYEVYQDLAAYESHRETEHFKTYIEETKDLLDKKELIQLTGDLLVNKGGLKK